uniref:Pulmonary surfactant-associated protein B n=3 Tax=Pararge aegeria TaxID=116150 RepID=S4P7C1_9NEOP
MTNTLAVCLLSLTFLCCTGLSAARQAPKECSKGPEYWCQSLRSAADCGAVGHCIGTVWEQQHDDFTDNEVSSKFVHLFKELKDVKEMINNDYLESRILSACRDAPRQVIYRLCKDNTARLGQYFSHVLKSSTTPETMCQIIGMCGSAKLDRLLANKKSEEPVHQKQVLVGANRCTWGPSYWCSNFSTGRECKATHHCVKKIWPKMDVPKDDDAVCNICKDMVTEARNELRSNATMEEIKDIFEGGCKLIPIKSVTQECIKIADDYVPEFVETLASEMSSGAVCSVVGLCNNANIDKIIEEHKTKAEEPVKEKPKMVGASKCTWGPSYWCSNFSTVRECKATPHCVKTVWAKMTVPKDDDGICKICKDMVTQARDQLESNETQEELKEVFEGSCKLIPIKLVAKECMKVADDFVPELVETLASQMNPDAVCSVAGLCNNANIDKLIEEYNATLKLHEGCTNCRRTVGIARKRFEGTQYDDFLFGLLNVCQNMASLSDSCSMLVFKYYENILEAVRMDFTPESVCHLSGQCSYKYHSHDLYTFPDDTKDLKATDDIPCEFCEQVIKHLRDTLVANTTEIEFHKVLVGLCKQTGSFKSECLQLVEEYHSTFYYFLVSELKPAQLCGYIGICTDKPNVPIAPLLPRELAVKVFANPKKLIGQDEAKSYATSKANQGMKKQASVKILGEEKSTIPPPLPIERMFIAQPKQNGWCSFCQYFLHYLQVELSSDSTESAIEKVVEEACTVLPKELEGECRQFVDQYGPAVIALLVQEFDPSSVCPDIGLCPKTEQVHDVTINSEKSNCPLCLFAVEQLESVLKNNRSEDNIRHALDGLCSHLSAKLRTECIDFVDTYTNQLIEMLIADLNAQEICVYLKLCKDDTKHTDPMKITHPSIDRYHEKPGLRGDRNNRRNSMLPKHMLETSVGGDIETNEIPDHTRNGRPVNNVNSPKTVCVMCEFVLKEIDDQIKDKHNDDEIKNVVHGVCKRMPKSVRQECDQFVEKYADLVISLLAQELNPDEVCRELKLCDQTFNAFREEILDCAVCETVVMALKKVLANDKVDRNIVHVVEKACSALPAKYYNRCHTMLEVYGESVIHLIETFGTKGVCQKIGLCSSSDAAFVHMYRGRH